MHALTESRAVRLLMTMTLVVVIAPRTSTLVRMPDWARFDREATRSADNGASVAHISPTDLVGDLVGEVPPIGTQTSTSALAARPLLWTLPDGTELELDGRAAGVATFPVLTADGTPQSWAQSVTWSGSAGDGASATFALVRTGGATWRFTGGAISAGDAGDFQVLADGPGRAVVQPLADPAVATTGAPDDRAHHDHVVAAPAPLTPGLSAWRAPSGAAAPAPAAASTPTTIEVLGAFTTDVDIDDALDHFVLGIAWTNQAFDNSSSASAPLSQVRARLVGLAPTGFAQSASIQTDFFAAANDAGLQQVRAAVGADIVGVVIERRPADGCGVSQYTNAPYVGDRAWGYNVTVRERPAVCVGRFAFPHELGHNLGAGHHPLDGYGGYFDDSWGHLVDGVARDLMSEAHSSSTSRALVYSNPERNFPGTTVRSGTSQRNNARAVAANAPVVAAYYAASATGGGLVTMVAPARVFDSRVGIGGAAAPWNAGETRAVAIAGARGLVPAGATAVVANVTVTGSLDEGWLAAWAHGDPMPPTSTTNFAPGQTRASTATIPIGEAGVIDVYASATTHVIIDVFGYIGGSSSTAAPLSTIAPTRVFDTRPGGPLTAGTARWVELAGSNGIPLGAKAVIANVTVTGPQSDGYLTAAASSRTDTSVLNFAAGETIANLVIVPVTPTGVARIASTATTDVIIDVLGWVGAGAGGSYRAIPPTRIHAAPMGAGTVEVVVRGVGGVPANATAVMVNVTGNVSSAWTFLTAYPAGRVAPIVSTVNLTRPTANANHVVVPIGANGEIAVSNAFGSTWLYVDVEGYVAP